MRGGDAAVAVPSLADQPVRQDHEEVGRHARVAGGAVAMSPVLDAEATEQVAEIDMLRRAAFYAGRTVQVLKVAGAGADHPWLTDVQESRYLKAVFCRVVD